MLQCKTKHLTRLLILLGIAAVLIGARSRSRHRTSYASMGYGHSSRRGPSYTPLNRYHPLKRSPLNNNPGDHGYPDRAATVQQVCVFTPLYGSGYQPFSVLNRYHGTHGSPFNGNPGDHAFPTGFSLPYAPSGLSYSSGYGGGHRGGYNPMILYCATTPAP
ncbi:PREDICTED: uncharacterized protein LOC106814556 [Priapulus caudatus]|uniref:Uncharacterized protein LOC106814556 n=1 Tax=Priapulus caudatus TaxID=37621 RepID=A0ABM1EQ95_PRICU|nr:PREDICTED: uncharacterized protein LOC106814556 [Priapulus caudatus]